jgi:hypothetical protein
MLKLNNNAKYTFTLNDTTYVLVKLVNIIGLDIATLVNERKQPGSYEVKFDGNKCPAGIYYYKLFAEDPAPNGAETLTMAECPDKKFKLIDTKEILIL